MGGGWAAIMVFQLEQKNMKCCYYFAGVFFVPNLAHLIDSHFVHLGNNILTSTNGKFLNLDIGGVDILTGLFNQCAESGIWQDGVLGSGKHSSLIIFLGVGDSCLCLIR